MMSLIAVLAGIVMIVVGGVLSFVGALRKSPKQISPIRTQSGQEVDSTIGLVGQEKHDVINEEGNQSPSTKSDFPLVADELSKLVALKEKGVLTEEEFACLKKNLLDGKNSNA
jgi:Short C-terminal domain